MSKATSDKSAAFRTCIRYTNEMSFRAATFCGCSRASPYQVLAIRYLFASFALLAHVAELADAYGSGPYGATRGGSSPLVSKA
jgi:hypothetical protein